MEGTDWSAYEKLVMAKLATMENDIHTLDEKLTLLRIDVAQLKIKAGVWGAAAGMLPALITALAVVAGGSPF